MSAYMWNSSQEPHSLLLLLKCFHSVGMLIWYIQCVHTVLAYTHACIWLEEIRQRTKTVATLLAFEKLINWFTLARSANLPFHAENLARNTYCLTHIRKLLLYSDEKKGTGRNATCIHFYYRFEQSVIEHIIIFVNNNNSLSLFIVFYIICWRFLYPLPPPA